MASLLMLRKGIDPSHHRVTNTHEQQGKCQSKIWTRNSLPIQPTRRRQIEDYIVTEILNLKLQKQGVKRSNSDHAVP